MKVKAKIGFAGVSFSATAGQVIDLPDAVAEDLIKAGFAEGVKNEDKRSDAGNDTKSTARKRGGTK